MPPALKKYLNWAALGNVTVFDVVALDVHALVVVVAAERSLPLAAASFLPFIIAVMFVLNAA